jgi:hypothetical protein
MASLIEVLVVVVMLLVVGDWLMDSWLVGIVLVDGVVAASGTVGVGGSCTCGTPVPVDDDDDDDKNDDSLEFWGC